MKSLFEKETLSEIRSRLDSLNENNERNWGQMTTGQMLHHCQAPLNVILEKNTYNLKPNWFAKMFFKKAMYNDKPWKKNLPTMRAFKETEPRDFNSEKRTLEQLLTEFEGEINREEWQPHPAFGAFTKAQWGKMQYKHLDHHFRQFGV